MRSGGTSEDFRSRERMRLSRYGEVGICPVALPGWAADVNATFAQSGGTTVGRWKISVRAGVSRVSTASRASRVSRYVGVVPGRDCLPRLGAHALKMPAASRLRSEPDLDFSPIDGNSCYHHE